MPPTLTRRSFLSAAAAGTVCSSIWAKATTARVSDPQLLSDIERRTFYFYWDRVNQSNGLMADRLSTPAACSTRGAVSDDRPYRDPSSACRNQFAPGLSTLSITSTSAGDLTRSNFSPICSWMAVNNPGGASGAAVCASSNAHCNLKS